ncbi:hypothetical protein NDU88_002581, partial [Pleurodeles waltl]
ATKSSHRRHHKGALHSSSECLKKGCSHDTDLQVPWRSRVSQTSVTRHSRLTKSQD